jgi:Flp pilus assembly protein CpaB
LRPLPVAGGLLIVVALIGYLSAYNHASTRSQVLVAARTLPAGTQLRSAMLTSSGLAAGPTLLATLLPARERNLVIGRVLQEPVVAGAPVPRAALAAPGRQASSFTLAVPILHALAGGLSSGDRVTVLATFTTAAGRNVTRAIARGLLVTSVGQTSGFDASSQTVPVTVALPDPSLASQLALANEAGKIDLLREGAGAKTAAIPQASAP